MTTLIFGHTEEYIVSHWLAPERVSIMTGETYAVTLRRCRNRAGLLATKIGTRWYVSPDGVQQLAAWKRVERERKGAS